MKLLERETQLQALDLALKQVRRGYGRIALVSGEAGIGKTALVNQFVADHASESRLLWGGCDALFTPHPLGPLYDMASQALFDLAGLLDQEHNWLTIARAFLTGLQRSRTPTLVVVEDVHWADAATLDLLKFLGRRLQPTPTLLILTFRDDELTLQHPLRVTLGDLAASGIGQHIQLTRLSPESVYRLAAGTEVDPVNLHRLTGGNPFFVTEALAADGGIPATVRDAVLARAGRLSPPGREVLAAAAVIGTRIEPWLLLQMTGVEAAVIDECMAVGMLQAQGNMLAFRHELARQVVLEATSPAQKLELHRLALDVLTPSAIAQRHPARLAHHAEGAGDATAVYKYALTAARQATAVHGHREAVAQYARALRFSATWPAAQRAQLWENYGQACGAVGQNEDAIEAHQRAAQIWREVGGPIHAGHNLSQMGQYLMRAGRHTEARQVIDRAIAILESQPRSRQLAWVYGLRSGLHMIQRELDDAIAWGKKARSSAEWFQDAEILAMNYIGLGSALMLAGDEAGRDYLQRSIAIATEAGLDLVAALATTNLAASAAETYQFKLADRFLSEGIAFCRERELDYFQARLLAWQAMVHLCQGRWAEAETVAAAILQQPQAEAGRLEALVVLARLHARRGQPGAAALLEEATTLARQTGLLQDMTPVWAARAEAGWLVGDHAFILSEFGPVYDLAVARRRPWFTGELACWRWRAGETLTLPEWAAAPFAHQIQGDWRAAAAAWEQLGCPYEHALALAEGDERAQLAALAILDDLGADAAAQTVRRKLRAAGRRGIPRGPRPATRANPFGLTSRQMDVLLLMADGLSNSEIAARLSISRRTVEHHVAAVLARLDVASRHAAVALAKAHNLTPTT